MAPYILPRRKHDIPVIKVLSMVRGVG
jgi:hypothetical protein